MDLPRRHHYLPQFLLRGFASRSKGKDFYAWMFRSTDSPFEANLKNLAQQRDFHGDPKNSRLEQIMSEHESRFAPVIEQLRSGDVPYAALPTIREFVAHLMVRTKNLRSGFVEASNVFFDQVEEAIPASSRRKWKHKLRKAARKELRDPKWRDLMQLLPKSKRASLTRMLEKDIRETDFRPLFSHLFSTLRQNTDIEAAADVGHINTLTREIAPQPRIDSISHLVWHVRTCDSHSFILGDVGVFGRCDGDANFRNLANTPSRIEIVVVPVSHSACLFGACANGKLPDVNEINENAAQLSREFFLASKCSQRETEYHVQLGKRAALIAETELSDIVDDIL